VLPEGAEDALGVKAGFGQPGKGSTARRREAAALGVLVLLLNIVAGALSLSNFGAVRGLAFTQEGKVAVCFGGGMHLLGANSEILPGNSDVPPLWQHECPCCVMAQAGAPLPPPAAGLKPAELTIVYVLRPGAARHLEAAAVATSRNRGPPSQA
jgi:hypothetical protein